MKSKSLAASNRHLRKRTSWIAIVHNAATSTSVETGKPSSLYVKRHSQSEKTVQSNNPTHLKKEAS